MHQRFKCTFFFTSKMYNRMCSSLCTCGPLRCTGTIAKKMYQTKCSLHFTWCEATPGWSGSSRCTCTCVRFFTPTASFLHRRCTTWGALHRRCNMCVHLIESSISEMVGDACPSVHVVYLRCKETKWCGGNAIHHALFVALCTAGALVPSSAVHLRCKARMHPRCKERRMGPGVASHQVKRVEHFRCISSPPYASQMQTVPFFAGAWGPKKANRLGIKLWKQCAFSARKADKYQY